MIRNVLRIAAMIVLGLLVILPIFEIVAGRLAAHRHPPPGRLVDVGGHRMHLWCTGEKGPTVVFEAGAGTSSLYWSLVQPEIAKRARACSYDRAGFGWSDGGPTPRTIPRVAGELRSLLKNARIVPPYVLVSHSMGGAVAMQYASEWPDEIAGMVFVDAAYKELYEAMLDQEPKLLGRVGQANLMLRAASVAAVFGLPRLAPLHMSDKRMPPDVRSASDALGVRPKFFNAMRAEIEGLLLSRTTASSEPPTDIPVAVLSHDEGKLFPKDPAMEQVWTQLQKRLAARFDDATLEVVEGAGHFIQFDDPQVVVRAIDDVIDRAKDRLRRQ